jgi:hypothetical protein
VNRITRGVVVAAVTLLALEAGVRAIDSALPEINAWREPIVAAKVKQMDALGAMGPTDVVLAGSSQMLFAADPAMLESLQVPWNAYNAALWGAPPVVNEHWLTEVVFPRLRPRTVVIGVSPLDFIEPVADAAQTYFKSSAVREDWLGGIERRVSKVSALVRHRRDLRSPKAVYDAVVRRMRGQPGPSVPAAGIDNSGRLPCCDELTFNPEVVDISTRELLEQVDRDGWELSDKQLAAFNRTVATLAAQGAEVLVVDMAISSPLIDVLGTGRYTAYQTLLRREAQTLRVPVLDMAGGLDRTTFFFDYDHVNRAGANVFNTVVARALASSSPGSFKEKVSSLPDSALAPIVAGDVLEQENALAEAKAKLPIPPAPAVEAPIPSAPVVTPAPRLDIPPLPTQLPRLVP